MKYVDVARSPGSALRVFTSSERPNHLKINEIGEVGKLVKKTEIGGWSTSRKMMKKVETGGVKVGELVKHFQMNEPQGGKLGRSVRVGQEEYLKPEQYAMLAEADEEDELIKSFDDSTGKELPWQAVKEAREKELKYLRELDVHEMVDEGAAVAKYKVTPVDTKSVDTDTAFDGEPMPIRSRIVAKEGSKVGTGRTCMRELSLWKL